MRDDSQPLHPGRILLDQVMVPLGISRNQLARDIDVPVGRISSITNGKRGISADTALRLAKYFGMDAELWMRLQAEFDLHLVRSITWPDIEPRVQVLQPGADAAPADEPQAEAGAAQAAAPSEADSENTDATPAAPALPAEKCRMTVFVDGEVEAIWSRDAEPDPVMQDEAGPEADGIERSAPETEADGHVPSVDPEVQAVVVEALERMLNTVGPREAGPRRRRKAAPKAAPAEPESAAASFATELSIDDDAAYLDELCEFETAFDIPDGPAEAEADAGADASWTEGGAEADATVVFLDRIARGAVPAEADLEPLTAEEEALIAAALAERYGAPESKGIVLDFPHATALPGAGEAADPALAMPARPESFAVDSHGRPLSDHGLIGEPVGPEAVDAAAKGLIATPDSRIADGRTSKKRSWSFRFWL